MSLFAQAGAADSPCVTTGELWTVDLCCAHILLGPALLPAGAWRQKAEGITLTVTVSSAHYRRVPAWDRPPAALTFVLGADWELRSTGSCADRRVFHYCWALGIVGNHHFQWNTIVSECRTRGNAASCVYNIIWVTRRWRSRESTRKLLEKELKKNRCLKHWSLERQRRHLNLNGGRGGGSDPQKISEGRANPITASSGPTVVFTGTVSILQRDTQQTSEFLLQRARCFLPEMCILSKLLGT